MNYINVCFPESDMNELKNLTGKKMIKYKCDPFEYSASVYGVVALAFENQSYAITNFVEVMDYYGDTEDVAIFKILQTPYTEICSMVENKEMVETPVDSIISKVLIVNERQLLYKNNEPIYEVLLTRGVIFHFKDEHELSFEKNIWFSEDITIQKGYDLIDRFSPTSEFCEGWSGDYRGECSREVILLD